MNTTGQVVITGCSSGLGRVTALHLARNGWQVFATVRREADRQSLSEEWQTQGGKGQLSILLCDITQTEQIEALRRAVATHTPQLTALINNAGTAFAAPLELLPITALRQQLEINTIAHVAVTQALLPHLKAARGLIVNVSSLGGRVVFPVTGAYHASKFAFEALSDALRVELAPWGVRVCVVEAGGSHTPIWSKGEMQGQLSEAKAQQNAYGALIQSYMNITAGVTRNGFPPQQFAELIERILRTPSPRARYQLGRWVGTTIMLRQLLPDWAWDAWVRRLYRW
jgi:NAD(P)-dependent dehydrogenase (short-subunit alcohol dehydrogenase family)